MTSVRLTSRLLLGSLLTACVQGYSEPLHCSTQDVHNDAAVALPPSPQALTIYSNIASQLAKVTPGAQQSHHIIDCAYIQVEWIASTPQEDFARSEQGRRAEGEAFSVETYVGFGDEG